LDVLELTAHVEHRLAAPSLGADIKLEHLASTGSFIDFIVAELSGETGLSMSAAKVITAPAISRHAVVYGDVSFGSGVLVEPWAIIGRPLESVLRAELADAPSAVDLDELYDRIGGRVTLNDDVLVRSGAVLYSDVVVGQGVEVGHHAVVREGVHIGPFTRVLAHTSIRKNATIQQGCRLGGVVGDGAVLGTYVTSLGYLIHDYKVAVGGEVEVAPRLESGSVVGRGAVVVGDVRIGEFAFVSAGAVVRKDVPARSIVAGDPARIVGKRSDDEIERLVNRMGEGSYL